MSSWNPFWNLSQSFLNQGMASVGYDEAGQPKNWDQPAPRTNKRISAGSPGMKSFKRKSGPQQSRASQNIANRGSSGPQRNQQNVPYQNGAGPFNQRLFRWCGIPDQYAQNIQNTYTDMMMNLEYQANQLSENAGKPFNPNSGADPFTHATRATYDRFVDDLETGLSSIENNLNTLHKGIHVSSNLDTAFHQARDQLVQMNQLNVISENDFTDLLDVLTGDYNFRKAQGSDLSADAYRSFIDQMIDDRLR
ncbi:hypothetical protein JM93_00546 [Roseibium hamelinense]|uniref:Uncharacterized protein n=1 Tax=Roseibium hamelinense TaxID=150831 RepID=A0A562TI01_9HYPH|nr:hypothetical protein [Roseibium hamelinense]MTI45825.1 hypothetical protein [Roseibium hamelinense]TWI92993.1 hypothetical protein JM93_00546 [Roseibium hamelinense]